MMTIMERKIMGTKETMEKKQKKKRKLKVKATKRELTQMQFLLIVFTLSTRKSKLRRRSSSEFLRS